MVSADTSASLVYLVAAIRFAPGAGLRIAREICRSYCTVGSLSYLHQIIVTKLGERRAYIRAPAPSVSSPSPPMKTFSSPFPRNTSRKFVPARFSMLTKVLVPLGNATYKFHNVKVRCESGRQELCSRTHKFHNSTDRATSFSVAELRSKTTSRVVDE